MSTVASCPRCQRKLKIASTSLGKSVKCPCGNVFKAMEVEDAPAPATDTMLIACGECGVKLKVPASAHGRKMKCSKCGATFVASGEDAAAALAVKSKPAPPMIADEPRPRKDRAKPPVIADDDATVSEPYIEYEAQEPRPPRKGKTPPTPVVEDEEETASRKQAAPAATPRGGCVLNLLVPLIVLAYVGVLVPMYLGYIDWLPYAKPPSGPAIRGDPAFQFNPKDATKKERDTEPK